MSKLLNGDCTKLETLGQLVTVDAIVTDPPYEIGIGGRDWDSTGVAHDPDTWGRLRHHLKKGGYLLAFGATRNHHRMTTAIETAGFEIQDEIPWLYAQGYPKGKGLLKPANEPIVVARNGGSPGLATDIRVEFKWPSNVAVDDHVSRWLADQGAPPFAFVAKPSPGERRLGTIGGYHETIKPLKLMRWLVEMVTAPGETVLDPFMGSGTTVAAALIEGRDAIGVELDPDNYRHAVVRIADLVAPYGIRVDTTEPWKEETNARTQ